MGQAARREERDRRRRYWTRRDINTLMAMLERGHGYDQVAQKLGIDRRRVQWKAASLGVSVRNLPVYGTCEVKRRFLRGAGRVRVLRWIDEGHLRATSTLSQGWGTQWRIRHEDLLEFLERRECWMEWDPADVLDLSTRLWITEVRQNEGWRWLTVDEVSEMLGYASSWMSAHCRRGTFLGVLPGTCNVVKQCGQWWIRSDVAEIVAADPVRFFDAPGPKPRRRA